MKTIFTLLLTVALPFWANAVCTPTGSPLTVAKTATDIRCSSNDGKIKLTASGGSVNTAMVNGTGYTYELTAGPTTRSSQAADSFLALPAGSYTYKVTDCSGATATGTIAVGGTAPAAITFNPKVYNSVCAGSNLTILSPAGGIKPYTFTIKKAPAGSNPVIKGDTISGLAAGSVDVDITDACGKTLGASFTQTTAAPIAAHLPTCVSYYPCKGQMHYTPVIAAVGANPWVDSLYTDLYFNGVYKQSKVLVTTIAYSYPNAHLFNTYGDGTYTLKTYAKCAGLINTDSFTVGNRPYVSSAKTRYARSLTTAFVNQTCTTFDLVLQQSAANISYNAVIPMGDTIDVLGTGYTAKIISGPSHTGDTAMGPPALGNTLSYAYLKRLSYSTTPYQIQIFDSCGHIDTLSVVNNSNAFTPAPARALNCGNNYVYVQSANKGLLFVPMVSTNVPKKGYLKATFLSGPPIWTSYPFSAIDSTSNTGTNWYLPGMPNTNYTLKVAYENGCGQKDTTVWTVTGGCSKTDSSKITVTPHCGNKGDLKLDRVNNAHYRIVQGPTGNTVGSGTAGTTYINQPSGDYRILEAHASNIADNVPAGPSYIKYVGITSTASEVTDPVYPFNNTVITRVVYTGPVDTSYLRAWDSTYTVQIPYSQFTLTATDAYTCRTGNSSAAMVANSKGNIPGMTYTYDWSATGINGPWTSAGTDSLISLPGVGNNTAVWIRATDTCGTTEQQQATTSDLRMRTTISCNNNIVTVSPGLNNPRLTYNLLRKSTGTVTQYAAGTPITIDMNSSSNAGDYVLYCALKSAANTSCMLDSTAFTVSPNCSAVILPIRLLAFQGKNENQVPVLSWQTAEEAGYRQYILERSENAENWLPVTVVPCKLKTENVYRFRDESYRMQATPVFYRLSMVANDGQLSYSPIIKISVSSDANNLSFYPNPVTDHIYISGLQQPAVVKITDLAGHEILKQSVTADAPAISLSGLPAGVYAITVQEGDKTPVKQMIGKQ